MTTVSTPTRKLSFLIESSLAVAHGVLFVKYASILLQAITVQIDEAFLYALMDVAKLDGIDWDADTERWAWLKVNKSNATTSKQRVGA